LPNKINTHLDKSLYEDATDLSGGQKQKLAIARSIYKMADLVILDEPTAALDPLAESEIYEHFNELTRSKTSIFISHRMSSSLFCDRILLLQDGRIAAFDSHENLMKEDNLYKELFEAQAKNYQS
jgi:ABC-type multidrug transport system fused ATPase/permease subunit